MSIMTKIFGQNVKGENGLCVFKKNLLKNFFNKESAADPNWPEIRLTDLAILCSITAIGTGIAGFVGTYIGASFLSEAPSEIAFTYGLPIGASTPPVGYILVSGYHTFKDTYQEVTWRNQSSSTPQP